MLLEVKSAYHSDDNLIAMTSLIWMCFLKQCKRPLILRASSGTVETNPTRNHVVLGSIPGLAQWVKDLALLWLGCGVGR